MNTLKCCIHKQWFRLVMLMNNISYPPSEQVCGVLSFILIGNIHTIIEIQSIHQHWQ